MSKFILGFNDYGLKASYSSSNTFLANLGLGQLNVDYSSSVLRTNGIADLTIDITLHDHHKLSVLGIIHHNLTPTATIQWKLFADSGRITLLPGGDTGEIVVGEFNEDIIRTSVHTMADIESAYLTVIVKDPANTDGFLQVGNIFCGQRHRTDCNMDYGLGHVPISLSSQFTSDGGINSYVSKPTKRSVNMQLSLRKLEEGDRAFKLFLKQGLSKRMIYKFDEDDIDNTLHQGIYTFCGTFQTLNPLTYPMFDVNAYQFSIQEEI